MAYSRTYLSLLAASSLAALAIGSGCAHEGADDSDSAAENLVAPSDLVISQIYGGGANKDAALKYDYVELAVDEISARRFTFGPEPDRYGNQ